MFQKKNALIVTGASRGLGVDIAAEAYRQGFPVALLARNSQDLQKVSEQFDDPSRVLALQVDITNPKATKEAVAAIRSKFGGISALVNNAGTWTGGDTVTNISEQDFDRSITLNFKTAFHITQEVLSVWKLDGQPPLAIMNIGASASVDSFAHVFSFAAAKGALRMMSQSLAAELGAKGVHVSHLLIEGILDNTRSRNFPGNEDLGNEYFIDQAPLSRQILHVLQQEKTCWTFEWNVKPSVAT
ncbi:SDR family oxidoreductase [Microbulbifer sp. EKSA008]|uniref:SDR family oxidoreductase n=1 Tax=Microbulbifer sp. EKSA008 TaxID=3243367 RepID=UPI00404375D9